MQSPRPPESKIIPRADMPRCIAELRANDRDVVFTNGCFDLLHCGHVDYLQFARAQGDALVIGLNSDISVAAIKGPDRPILPEAERALLLGALECVDYVVLFDEEEPTALITELLPTVLVKGEDWAHYVAGREVVEKHGGRVVLAPLTEGRSTTNIIKKIISMHERNHSE